MTKLSMTDKEMMKVYGKASDFGSRFIYLALGIAGFFFPGWYFHMNMQLIKTSMGVKAFSYSYPWSIEETWPLP
jgi:hypothetical protein